MDVGVPLAATPTETAPETEQLGRGDASYGGGAPVTEGEPDRSADVVYPPDNTLGQPTDPDRA
jgi:hypothetical protein